MQESHFAAVRAFHEAIGSPGPAAPAIPAPAVAALRRTLLREEFDELLAALDHEDLTAIAHEAVDLLYVTYGLCLAYGIDADAVFAEVQRANMAKAAGPRRADGKQLKPAGWTPPDVAGTLGRREEAGEALAVELVFDGGSEGNPGRGYGSYRLTINGAARPVKRLRFGGGVTNNEAEYDTLIAALEEIQAKSRDLGRTTLQIRGDSQLVIKQLTGEWRAKDPRMAARRDRALGLLAPLRAWRAAWHDRRESVAILGH